MFPVMSSSIFLLQRQRMIFWAPILAAKKCLLLACFAEQTAPLSAIFARGGEPTPFLPASYLWRHPDYRLIYTTDKIAI